jgi:transposase-like protein
MARKHFSTEQMIGMLREAEVRLSQGQTIDLICEGFGISEQSYYRWRRDHGGLIAKPGTHRLGRKFGAVVGPDMLRQAMDGEQIRQAPLTINVRLLRDELLTGEIFTTLREAQMLIENWRRNYNGVRPHSSLGLRPPAPETILPPVFDLTGAQLRTGRTLANHRRILT